MSKNKYAQAMKYLRGQSALKRQTPEQMKASWKKKQGVLYVYEGVEFILAPLSLTTYNDDGRYNLRLLMEGGIPIAEIRKGVERRLRESHAALKKIQERDGDVDVAEHKEKILEFCFLVAQNVLCKTIPPSDSFGIAKSGEKPFSVEVVY
jgi:hypothetical protein